MKTGGKGRSCKRGMEVHGVIRPRRRDQTGEGVFNLEWRLATSGRACVLSFVNRGLLELLRASAAAAQQTGRGGGG